MFKKLPKLKPKNEYTLNKETVLHSLNKKKKRLWIILVLISLSLIVFFTSIGFRIQYLILDELQIDITPLQKTISTQNNKVIPLSFEVENKNFNTCKTTCDFVLTDTYTNEVLRNRSLKLDSNQKVIESYNLSLNVSGEGQRIYYFEAECSNIRTSICQTNEEQKYRSAIITINYTYSDQEKNLLDNLKEKILLKYSEYLNASEHERELESYIKQIKERIPTNKFLVKKAGEYLKELDKIKELYDNQKLSQAADKLSKLPNLSYITELTSLKQEINIYNFNIDTINLLNSNEYMSAYDFYIRTNASKSDSIKEIYNNLLDSNLTTFEDIISFKELRDKSDIITKLVLEYPREKNSTEIAYKNITEKNYRKFDNLAYNLSDDLCPDTLLVQNTEKEYNYSVALINYSEIIVYCTKIYSPLPKLVTFDGIELDYSKTPVLSFALDNPAPICCIYGNCSSCSINPKTYPVIFIHGHSFNKKDPPETSIDAFTKIQKKLSDDKLIINAGDIDYSTAYTGHWSIVNYTLGVRATYYYIPYYETDLIFKSIRKEEGIESYSLRLKELIDIVLANTGAEKVNIVAHSMGGLVTRNYLAIFGEDKVNSITLIGTPNKGISGRTEKRCTYFGDRKACSDMNQNSIFLKRLQRYKPNIPVNLIVGRGCDTDEEDGDGVVTVNSSVLDYADVTYIDGECTDFLSIGLHSDLLDPEKYPEVYNRVKEIIIKK